MDDEPGKAGSGIASSGASSSGTSSSDTGRTGRRAGTERTDRRADAERSRRHADGRADAGTGPDAALAVDAPGSRRARREARDALLRNPVLPPLAIVPRPAVVVTTVVVCALLVLAVAVDAVLLAAGLAWTGLVLAWGWPGLLGSSSRFGSSLAIGVSAVLAPVAAASIDQPYLRWVPGAMTVGMALMFGHQLVRRDGRPRLTDSIAVTSLALAVVAVGAAWVPLARDEGSAGLAAVAFVAVAAGSLADLGAGVRAVRPWLLPAAMSLGGVAAVVAAGVLPGPGAGPAALVGLLVAAVSHAVRRVLCVLPPVAGLRGQLSAAAAGVLAPGVVAYVLTRALVG
ncbi:MAG: hypothetical protein ACRCSN_12580 [Dermatophilaceae bacterium]